MKCRRRAIVAIFVLFSRVPALFGGEKPSEKIRGRIQDFERARRLLVIYPRNRASQAKDAARKVGLTVIQDERKLSTLRCRWDWNDRRKLARMLGSVGKP
jgi:hypothetical protein